ncbi:hypothetical protein BIW11_04102 [Tropilaelaps mercedesae]|uniref:Uncharacterized protein n=1 Tax=Tropilaelaps mercedesae TaxID=418985 RepID=A0A1V9XB40_9ACAR|nr:hypothetical protein BIW11_04102 [Tropilaelaps mercedesae]
MQRSLSDWQNRDRENVDMRKSMGRSALHGRVRIWFVTKKAYLSMMENRIDENMGAAPQTFLMHLGKPGHLVYYNISAEPSTVMINEQLTAALWEELVRPMQEPCQSAAELLLCHYAFPKCEWRERVAIAKPLCR